MVSSHLPTVKFNCAGCGSQYEVPEAMAGRRGPCAKCGAEITVPGKASAVSAADLDEPLYRETHFRSPQYVAVDCRVCQTRMYGTPDQVGQEMKCPDCGARTRLLAAPKSAGKNVPAAMEGDQYELMDDTPLSPGQLAAVQPVYIALRCKLCDTLMHARPSQVGDAIVCPDCGKKNIVPPPLAVRPAQSVLTSDGSDYKVDRSADPGERPAMILQKSNIMQFEVERDAALADRSPAAVRRRKRLDARGRPILPRRPLVTGILPFLFSTGVPGWWVLLSLGYAVCGFLILDAAAFAPRGGLMAFSALISFVLGMIPTFVLTAVASTCFLSIITESSDGHDEIQNWNTRYISEWIPQLLYVISAVSASTVPGALIIRQITDDFWIRIAVACAGTVLMLPVVLLSQLLLSSPWGVVSGKILATMSRCPGSWLLFYCESALLFGICIGGSWLATSRGISPIVLTPLYVAAILLYARLLGRLAWRLAEATPVDE